MKRVITDPEDHSRDIFSARGDEADSGLTVHADHVPLLPYTRWSMSLLWWSCRFPRF